MINSSNVTTTHSRFRGEIDKFVRASVFRFNLKFCYSINSRRAVVACMNKDKLEEASKVSLSFIRFLLPKLKYFVFSF